MGWILINAILCVIGDVAISTSLKGVLKYIAFGAMKRAKGRVRYKKILRNSKLIDILSGAYLLPHVNEKRRKLFFRYRMIYLVYLLYCCTAAITYIVVACFNEEISLVVMITTFLPKVAMLLWLRIAIYRDGMNALPTIQR